LNGAYGEKLSPKLISLFFALDRFDASFELKKDIQKYDYVLSNRYVSSNMIHQGAKIIETTGVDIHSSQISSFLTWEEDIEYRICELPHPDKIFFLDMPSDFSLKLIQNKEQRSYIKD
jgi:dTMP kinase